MLKSEAVASPKIRVERISKMLPQPGPSILKGSNVVFLGVV